MVFLMGFTCYLSSMSDFGILSVLPPVLAIILALRTKQVYISLVVGIWLAWVIIEDWNPLQGTVATLEGFVDVFRNPGNTKTIMFSALVGALLIFIQYSGGVQGFTNWMERLLQRIERNGKSRSNIRNY